GVVETGYQLIDAVVAPEHRNKGLFGHLVRVLCEIAEKQRLILFAFPNDRSLSVYRKTGLLQSIGAYQTRVRVLSWPAYVRYRLGRYGAATTERHEHADDGNRSQDD